MSKCKCSCHKGFVIHSNFKNGHCAVCQPKILPFQKKLIKKYSGRPLIATQDKRERWEDDLKLYLTSAGDRRRTIYFIKNLLSAQRQEIRKKIKEMKHTCKMEKCGNVHKCFNEAFDAVLDEIKRGGVNEFRI